MYSNPDLKLAHRPSANVDFNKLKINNTHQMANKPFQVNSQTYIMIVTDNLAKLCSVQFSEHSYHKDPDDKCFFLWSIRDPGWLVAAYTFQEWFDFLATTN